MMADTRKKKVATLLLGREGSVGFPNKNIYPILGRPLLLHPILAANNSRCVDEVYFSTDSESYKKGREQGAPFIDHPPELATKEALGDDAFCHGYRFIRDKWNEKGSFFVIPPPSCPKLSTRE